jgi:hypothetical protein
MAKQKVTKSANTIKAATLFDFIDGVTSKKKEWDQSGLKWIKKHLVHS